MPIAGFAQTLAIGAGAGLPLISMQFATVGWYWLDAGLRAGPVKIPRQIRHFLSARFRFFFDLPAGVVARRSADRPARIGRNSSSGAPMEITAGQASRRCFAFRSATLGSK